MIEPVDQRPIWISGAREPQSLLYNSEAYGKVSGAYVGVKFG